MMRSKSTLPPSFAGSSRSFFTSRAQPALFPPRQEIYFLRDSRAIEQKTKMESTAHIYEIRPRKDQSGFDLISDTLASGRLSYETATDAIKYAKAHCRSHDAVILVYDESGNVIEAYEHSKEFRRQFDEYVKSSWRSSSEWVLETQSQLTKWLFTLHGAGMAGSLGFAHSRGLSCPLIASLVAFVFGIVCLLIWAHVDVLFRYVAFYGA
jgi:hypothetical protein